jgi:hypothetical protein
VAWRDQANRQRQAELLDASGLGAFVACEAGVQANQPLSLRVTASGPWDEELELTASVRWAGFSQAHECTGFGVQFDVPAEELDKLLSTRAWWPAP